ncbi:unnamed protein product [Rotaria sp. Silwood1]|nr:unnamed protein product [Rotaria sp. Silwood1]CAF3662602.1 unnamed protein product [Rotaria sp. Silwood1]CAF4672472.1 unnamed protein product [Rotaria sp. Silwood1]CAF4781429.1 unnamed protein product [Rotaria sp. Silwood1]
MNRNHFLGNIDLSIVHSLLTNYSVPTKIPNCIKLNKIKQQDDLVLIELGSLLTTKKCDEILMNIDEEKFQKMNKNYDTHQRNNRRLIVIDDRFARTLWRRLKFSHRITKLVSNIKPLGFNVQGTWQMSGVNRAMRLNKYHDNEYFTVHKDAQYAPSGDERSLLSLIIYLNDDFEEGLTIKEEIEAYGGLDHGYECITIKPKKGHAILFTHNLLHEAVVPETNNSNDIKELSQEERNDYYAYLNFFREAQQNELKICKGLNKSVNNIDIGELYERSLSIRYYYSRLLELKSRESTMDLDEQKSLIEQLPTEMWLSIFKYLDKQDIQHLIFAFPDFQLLKIVWEAQELKKFEQDTSRPKFIPIIDTQYGSQTLFRFSDSNFFNQHINQCCRVAAVYAFFLLGHDKDATTYTVHYDRNTHEVCEVDMEKILSDVFYNQNCYGSLYRVVQKDKKERQPMIDLDHSVDRTYMTNRHQSQFIEQDLLSRFHFKMKMVYESKDKERSWKRFGYESDRKLDILYLQRKHALCDQSALVGPYEAPSRYEKHFYTSDSTIYSRNDTIGYHEQLLGQIEQNSGVSLCRMLAAKDHVTKEFLCDCSLFTTDINEVKDLIVCYNQLIFDFDTHQLAVEHLYDKMPHDLDVRTSSWYYGSLLHCCVRKLQDSMPQANPISFCRVNIEKLTEEIKGFNHASCQCSYPAIKVNQFSFPLAIHICHMLT